LKMGGVGRKGRIGVSSGTLRDTDASENSRTRLRPALGGGRGVAGKSRYPFFPRVEAGGLRTDAANSCS
jgi:hypothetical protein